MLGCYLHALLRHFPCESFSNLQFLFTYNSHINRRNSTKLSFGDILTAHSKFCWKVKRHAKLIAFFFYFVFRYWIAPIGKSIGIKSTRSKRAAPNQILEAAYNENNRLRHKTVS